MENTYKLVPMTEADLAAQRVKHAEYNDTPIQFSRPHIEPHEGGPQLKLPVGTKVVFTNDYGISFSGLTIIRVERDEYGDAYYTDQVNITKADGTNVLHWSPYRRRHLTIQGNS